MKERNNLCLRIFDRYLGVPIICLLGLFRRKRNPAPDKHWKRNPQVLFIKTAGIGDTLLLSGIAREVRDYFPEAVISILCARSNAQAAELIPHFDKILTFDFSKFAASLKDLRASGRYDLLFDFGPWPRINSLISFLAKADLKIGFNRKKAYRHYNYDIVADHLDTVHELENYRNLLRKTGLTPQGFPPQIQYPPKCSGIVNSLPHDSRPMVVIHPYPAGIKSEFKEWPIDNWVILAGELINLGCKVLISGGKEDISKARELEMRIGMRYDNCLSIAGRYSLTELSEILANCRLLISVNTGIMHLGAAVGVNLISLNGPTSTIRWGPVSQNAINLVSQNECAPCLSLGFEYKCKSGGCMNTITVENVIRAARRFIDIDKMFPTMASITSKENIESISTSASEFCHAG